MLDNAEISAAVMEVPETGYYANLGPLYDTYTDSIKDYDILTKEEEYELFKRYKENNDQEAFNKIYLHNLKYVVHIANQYAAGRKTMEPMDLIQEGNIGLITAMQKFDYNLGYKFSTYATWWIKQTIFRSISNSDEAIRIPVHLQETYMKIRKRVAEAETKKNRALTTEEKNAIIKKIIKRKDGLDPLLIYGNVNSLKAPTSLDKPVSNNEEETETLLGDFIPDMDDKFEKIIYDNLKNEIDTDLSECLSKREKHVIERRFGLKEYGSSTLGEIGNELGLTRERVRQIEGKAIRKLRQSRKIKQLRAYLE